MAIYTLHHGDLPDDFTPASRVAIDCETRGLYLERDRLCLAQISNGDGHAHLVQFAPGQYDAPNLSAIITDPEIEKLFHYGRFDIAALAKYVGALTVNVFDTKIASFLTRTTTSAHGLATLCHELLGTGLDKSMQVSDWGVDELSPAQCEYAAQDVLFLHDLRDELIKLLDRENRHHLAKKCFDFLPHRAELDLAGWWEQDIFSHHDVSQYPFR